METENPPTCVGGSFYSVSVEDAVGVLAAQQTVVDQGQVLVHGLLLRLVRRQQRLPLPIQEDLLGDAPEGFEQGIHVAVEGRAVQVIWML